MKLASTLSLGIALALSATGLSISTAALSKKKEEAPKGPTAQLSKEFRLAMGPIEAEIAKKAYEGLLPKLDALEAVSAGPDEKFYVNYKRYDIAKSTNNVAQQRRAVIGMIDSKSALATNMMQLNFAAGQFAYNAKDYSDAIARLNESVRLGNKDADALIILAEACFQSGKTAEGLGYADQAIATKTTAGQKAPEDWYKRALSVAYKSKMMPQVAKLSRMQAQSYPTAENWRTALVLYRDGSKLEGQQQLDLFRLMRRAKAVAGERDFFEYAQLATERGLPGEAKAVIEEGMASGAIGKVSRPINELLATASAKVSGDLASLASSEKSASSAANGKLAAGTADAFLGYGQDAKAAALYRIALQKGQVDVDQVNTRLGIALARQGMKEEARKAFSAVTGQRAEIAKFWLLWLDNPSIPTA